MTANRRSSTVVNIAAVSLFALGTAVASMATAVADPLPDPMLVPGQPAPPPPGAPPPPDAPPPPPPGPMIPVIGMPLGPNGFNVLAQNGTEQNPAALGAPIVNGLDETTVLGQNATPAPPGAFPGVVPNLNVFNNQYGIQQNIAPAAPGQGEQFDVPPGQEGADVSRREWFGRYIDMQREGMLKGGLLGQAPQESLGQPLPGTAPPPGTNIPPGLGQFLPEPPDPNAPPPPPPGAPPLLLPPPPG